ncbi:MAG: Uma2 family endonuclease [Clostridia bacterium]|nr:Uma2 family endonuclease [Clostridia bacterium]
MRYLTPAEAAAMLKLHPKTVRHKLRTGQLRGVKTGKEWRIPETELGALMDGRSSPGSMSLVSAASYFTMPEDVHPTELLMGVLVREPSPTPAHSRVTKRVFRELARQVEDAGLGEVFLAPQDVVLSPDTVVQPDVFVVGREQATIVGERIQGAPLLVVEVESPSTAERDLTSKRLLYATHGVKEYWFVSPSDQAVWQFWDPTATGYRRQALVRANADLTLRSVVFPPVEIEVQSLFRS